MKRKENRGRISKTSCTMSFTVGKNVLFAGNPIKISLQYCLISLHFFMYFFILEVQILSKCQSFPATRFLGPLIFPGMMSLAIFWTCFFCQFWSLCSQLALDFHCWTGNVLSSLSFVCLTVCKLKSVRWFGPKTFPTSPSLPVKVNFKQSKCNNQGST